MLSLKGMTINVPKTTTDICDLPEELLDHIVSHLYNDSGRFLRSITALSLTCQRLRKATLPILFDTITIAVGSKLQQQEFVTQRTLELLTHLAKYPNIADYVRHLRAFIPVQGREDTKPPALLNKSTSEYQLALIAFRNLTSLRLVR